MQFKKSVGMTCLDAWAWCNEGILGSQVAIQTHVKQAKRSSEEVVDSVPEIALQGAQDAVEASPLHGEQDGL